MNAYEEKINSLIPAADEIAKLAMEQLGRVAEKRAGAGGTTRLHCFKTEFFHRAMNKLAYDAGLRGWK